MAKLKPGSFQPAYKHTLTSSVEPLTAYNMGTQLNKHIFVTTEHEQHNMTPLMTYNRCL